MKYRLKKDLPFAKAGAELIVHTFRTYVKGFDDFAIAYTKELDKLVESGWIEEVKPREFWITEHRECPEGIVVRTSVSNAKISCRSGLGCEHIKVREVIE